MDNDPAFKIVNDNSFWEVIDPFIASNGHEEAQGTRRSEMLLRG